MIYFRRAEIILNSFRTYEQKEGGAFELKQEIEIADPPDVTGLTNKRDELLRDNAELKRKFDGIDPDKARAALQKVGELETKDKGNVDRLTQIEQRLEASEKAREAAEANAAIERLRSMGSTAISTAKGRPEALVLLMPIIERRSKIVDGATQIFMDDGKTLALDKAGAPLTMDGLVAELKTISSAISCVNQSFHYVFDRKPPFAFMERLAHSLFLE